MEDIRDQAMGILEASKEVSDVLSSLTRQLQSLKRKTLKQQNTMRRQLSAAMKKKSRRGGGFTSPVRISEELCKFLNSPPGTLLARTEVTKKLNEYIKSNKLQRPIDRRIVDPDKKLASLLGTSNGFSFFELQGLMNRHFNTHTFHAGNQEEEEDEVQIHT
jgi:chromatin remodeling complex protein RSC6